MHSIYLHIPFCLGKCRYCDFNSYPGLSALYDSYTEALAAEISFWARSPHLTQYTGGSTLTGLDTIYLGGGTPSLLDPGSIGHLLDACRGFGLKKRTEVTMEANPGTVDLTRLRALRDAGINRLSLGVQSLDDAMLLRLGRLHSAAEARRAYELTRQAGFANVSVDLIYGLPGQDVQHWALTLQEILALEPEHLSLYALTLEEGTPMEIDAAAGRLILPDQDQSADMYSLAESMLDQAGYEHYEISNWARPGYQCRHNLTYWRNESYLGCGAGAHSSFPGLRFHNRAKPADYIAGVCRPGRDPALQPREDGSPPGPGEIRGPSMGADRDSPPGEVAGLPWVEGVEVLTREDSLAETIILGLRLREGVDLGSLAAQLQLDPSSFDDRCRDLAAAGLLWHDKGRIGLTARGRLLGNEVFICFLPPVCAAKA